MTTAASTGERCPRPALRALAEAHVLGSLLEQVARFGPYELLDHWQQGEFHHDVLLRVGQAARVFGGEVLVVATNCNGGVKEVLCFRQVPARDALWHWRCPDDPAFVGELPELVGRAITTHWFPPCELLGPDARSELREEHRERQRGGGWGLKR